MIELTPEQREQIRQAREAGERRIVLATTADQRAEMERVIAEEDAAMTENREHARKRHLAQAEQGFAGDLRRAIVRSDQSLSDIATSIGISEHELDEFCGGEGELPSDVVARLVSLLGLRLMAEIR